MAVRVLVVDDHEITCEGVSALLRKCEDIQVVGQAPGGRVAIQLVNETSPDVVIMDIGMPNLNGIEATRQLIEHHPTVKVMALSTYSDGPTVDKMFKAGARGYMLKESAFSELLEGLSTMLEGRIFMCSRISKLIFSDYVNIITNPTWTQGNGLSGREREILQLVAEGHASKEIAKQLEISPKTVDSHREHIMEKLGIRNIAGLTKYALRERLTSP